MEIKETVRLEELFVSAWKGKENADCLWWDGEWWSWNRLNSLADSCAEKLKESGFSKGQRVAALLPNSPMIIALVIACWRLGGAVAPLNSRTGVSNIMATIEKLDVQAIVVTPAAKEKSLASGKEVKYPIVAADPSGGFIHGWKGRTGTPDTEDTAIIFSTSGTSGLPKAVATTHSNLLDNIKQITLRLPDIVAPEAVFLNVLPNFHTYGSNVAQYLPLLLGVRQSVVASFVPVAATVNQIIASGVNTIIAVPTVIGFLIGALEKAGMHLKMRNLISGGDKFNPKLDEKCADFLGCHVNEGYGLTETSPVVCLGGSASDRKLGKVGRILDSFEAQIRDRDGNIIGMHDEGVLWVKGPSVVSSYFRDTINTNERFKDGWFNTGDVVRIDEDGFVQIVDRATDIIIVSGFNVYPEEVEAVMSKHPAVHQAIAVGEKNNVTGELVKAFVILKPDVQVTERALMDYCKEHMAHYKVPRKIGFVTEFPLSATGKILRRELRKVKIKKT